MPKVLITGGTGFVGLAAAEALLARGAEVVLFGPAPIPEPYRHTPVARAATTVIGDVRDAEDVARALALAPTHVLHMAAVTPDEARERTDPAGIAAVNLGGTLTLMRALGPASARPRVVVLSSVAVYGFAPPGPDGLYDEVASPPDPAALYGITKLAAERAALRLAALYALDLTAIRLGAVFGPWEHRSGARDLMSPQGQAMDAARAGHPVRLPRAMHSDWLYSRDAGAAIAAILLDGARSPVLNVGGPAVSDVAQWCGLLADRVPGFDWRVATPETATVRYGMAADRPAISNARLLAETAFRHRYDLAAACADYLDWLDGLEGP